MSAQRFDVARLTAWAASEAGTRSAAREVLVDTCYLVGKLWIVGATETEVRAEVTRYLDGKAPRPERAAAPKMIRWSERVGQ